MPFLRELIDAAVPDLRAIRRDLHAHPEIGYEEHRTSQVVQRELAKLGISFKAGLAGGTGVVALLPATAPSSGRLAVGLRADMDALPITEQTGLPYASTVQGKMHACGHDGHTTILLGAARVLSKLPNRPHPIAFVFQPAEEGGAGAERLCDEGLIEGKLGGVPIGRMFGLHGWPDMPLGHIATRPGPLLASTDEFRVTIRGTQAHAAYPHYSRDPVLAAAACISALQQIASRNVGPLDSVVVSVCIVSAGTASNVIPNHAEFVGTIRTLRAETRALARRRFDEIVTHTAQAHGCTAEVAIEEGYPVTSNDAALTDRFFALQRANFGPERVGLVAEPSMGGEDFSFYSLRTPSVFFLLGLRPPGVERMPSLHQPDFNFNDDAIPMGIEAFCCVALAE